jgi:hypothetical protein
MQRTPGNNATVQHAKPQHATRKITVGLRDIELQRWVAVTVGTTTYKSAAGKRRYLHPRSISARRTSRRPRTGMGLQRSMKRADSKRIACGAIGTTCRERARCLCESAVTPAAPLPLRALIRADRDNVPCNRRGSGLGEATRSNEKNAAAQTAGSAHALARVCVTRACGPGIACEPDRVRC